MTTPRIYPTLQLAQQCVLPNTYSPFIVQQEDRKFLVFKSVDDYLSKKEEFCHCHEVMVKNVGRLVFDFDLLFENFKADFPLNFFSEFENCVRIVFNTHYKKMPNMKLVWLKCENKKKISLHLIVKGAYFSEDWKVQMIDFYAKIQDVIDKNDTFSFYEGKLIDTQIARIHATLRMPLNSKIGGNPLLFYFEGQEEKVDFYDGLIGAYRFSDLQVETKLMKADLIQPIQDKEPVHFESVDFNPDLVYNKFVKYNEGEIFKMGNVDYKKGFITLLRKKPSNCLVNPERYHESDNSYLVINSTGIYFGCHRGCTYNNKKLYLIEKFSPSKIVMEEKKSHPAFELFDKVLNQQKKAFTYGQVKDDFISLTRVLPSRCLLSNQTHETEDGYLTIHDNKVYFGCCKKCLNLKGKNHILVGTL